MTLPQRFLYRLAIPMVTLLTMVASLSAINASPAAAADDQLTQLAMRRLTVFTNWLETYQVPGVIGEMGYPGNRDATEQAKWNALASKWYAQATAENVPVAFWGTGEDAMLDPFQNGRADAQVSVISKQAPEQRGINLGGGEYGDNYPSNDQITKAAAAGFTWVRLPFKWETIQPTANQPLNQQALTKLKGVVNAILAAGMTVELDNHNYNRYYGGTATGAQLGDFWARMAPNFTDKRVSFGLMNEPYPDADANWQSVSQATVTAIRNTGSTNLVSVSGKFWSNAHRWSCQQPRPWITDPANNYRYEAHTYFDAINEGRYVDSYDNTYSQSVQRGGVAAANECPFNAEGAAANGPPPPPGGPTGGTPATTTTTVRPTTPTTAPPATTPPTTTNNTTTAAGYRVVTANGRVVGFGGQATTYGDAPAGANIAAIANTYNDRGYWLVGRDGSVYAFGNANFYGSMGGKGLSAPIVGMAATPSGNGYWLLGQDGGVFSFGDATFYGSTGDLNLNAPVVGMTATPTGKGYWFVATDGGIFAFGDAKFFGSTGSMKLNRPIVGMAANPGGTGYWLVGSDGGIFAFNTKFYGSTGDLTLNEPIVGMVVSSGGDGYRFVATDGGVFAFGNAPFAGSIAGQDTGGGVRSISA